MSSERDPQTFTIRGGLSAARFVHSTPELSALTKRLHNNFSPQEGVLTRHFGQVDSHGEFRVPSHRIFKTDEIRKRFANARINNANAGRLISVIGSLLTNLSCLSQDTETLTYRTARQCFSDDRKQFHVVLSPGKAAKDYLNHERRTSLRAIQQAINVKQTDWPSSDCEIILATLPSDTSPKIVQTMANLVDSHCPVQITLGPARFEPDPRFFFTPAQ